MTDHNPPFTKHMAVLRERVDFLTYKIESDPEHVALSFWVEERKAVRWALTVVEGELAQEKDPGDMARYFSQTCRVKSELEKEFKLFLQFLEFTEWHRADEKVKHLRFDW